MLGRIRTLTAAAVLAASFAMASPALADEYEPTYAGHPLRIAAYVVHPIGVILDYVLFRPAHWIVMHEPFETLFGHEEFDRS